MSDQIYTWRVEIMVKARGSIRTRVVSVKAGDREGAGARVRQRYGDRLWSVGFISLGNERVDF